MFRWNTYTLRSCRLRNYLRVQLCIQMGLNVKKKLWQKNDRSIKAVYLRKIQTVISVPYIYYIIIIWCFCIKIKSKLLLHNFYDEVDLVLRTVQNYLFWNHGAWPVSYAELRVLTLEYLYFHFLLATFRQSKYKTSSTCVSMGSSMGITFMFLPDVPDSTCL